MLAKIAILIVDSCFTSALHSVGGVLLGHPIRKIVNF